MMLRRIHLLLGGLMFVAFLLTGQFMDRYHNHLEGVELGTRLLYRTRHIFILFAALLHLGLGAYLRAGALRWQRTLQSFGSLLIVVASGLLLAAFFHEPAVRDLETPLTHWSTFLILPGTLCHVAATVQRSR